MDSLDTYYNLKQLSSYNPTYCIPKLNLILTRTLRPAISLKHTFEVVRTGQNALTTMDSN